MRFHPTPHGRIVTSIDTTYCVNKLALFAPVPNPNQQVFDAWPFFCQPDAKISYAYIHRTIPTRQFRRASRTPVTGVSAFPVFALRGRALTSQEHP